MAVSKKEEYWVTGTNVVVEVTVVLCVTVSWVVDLAVTVVPRVAVAVCWRKLEQKAAFTLLLGPLREAIGAFF